MKKFLKRYWWLFLIIPGLPIILNFLVFKPTSQYSVGTLHDWMSFLGSYLGATISSLTAFIILYIQREDHQEEVIQSRLEKQVKKAKDLHRFHNDLNRIIKEIQNLKNAK